MTKRKTAKSGVDALLANDGGPPEQHQTKRDKDKKSVWLYVPEGLLRLIRSQEKRLPIGNIRGIIQFIDGLHRSNISKGVEESRMHWKFLRKNVININRGVLRWIIDNEIVVKSSGYTPRKKSTAYAFSKEWKSRTMSLVKFSDRKMYGKLLSQKNRPVEGLPYHIRKLRDCVRMMEVDTVNFETDRRKVEHEHQENPWG